MATVNVTDENFDEEVIKAGKTSYSWFLVL